LFDFGKGSWLLDKGKEKGGISMEVVATAGCIRDKGGEKPWNLSQMLFHSRSVCTIK
jgi:hypothetical protein